MIHKATTINKTKKTSNILLKWITSYMSILMIPLLICSSYYFHSYSIIKNETIERQHLTLKNVKTQLDNDFNDLIQISTSLQMNQLVGSFSYKDARSPNIHQESNKLMEALSVFMLTNPFIKEIYIYFPKSNYILTSSTIYSNNLTNYMPSRYISQNTWSYLTANFNLNSNQLLLADQDCKLLFASTLIKNNTLNAPLSIVVFEINKTALTDFLDEQLILRNFSALSLEKNGVNLISTDSNLTKQSEIFNFFNAKTTKNSVSFSDNNTKYSYMIDSVDLDMSNLRLISFTGEKVYNNETTSLLFVLFLSVFISLLIGSIITYYYSINNYRPVKEIIGCIDSISTCSEEKNEYSKIKDILMKTNSELKTQRDLLRNNYLYKLLTGDILLSEVSPSIASQFQINFVSDSSYVILIRSALRTDTSNSERNKTICFENNLAFFITQNILQEIFYPFFSNIYFCHNQAETGIILNVSEPETLHNSFLTDGLNTFITYCKVHFNADFYISVSNLCSNEHLFHAYTQASNTLEYMHLFDVGKLLHYSEIPKTSSIGYLHLKTSDYVINLVMSAGSQALQEYFEYMRQELKQNNLSTSDAKSCLYFFYNVTMKLRAKLQYQHPHISTEEIFNLNNQFFNYSLLEAIDFIETLYKQVMDLLQQQNLNSSDKKIQEVIQYIESNYFDCNLNLNSIATHFNITPSYFSQKFRQKTGLSVTDYLYKIRISHSLVLIKDTSLKISEIAQMVGFLDSNAFIRIFKKYQGCTPGNFKNSYIEGFVKV